MSDALCLSVDDAELSAPDSVLSSKAVHQHPQQWMKRVAQTTAATMACAACVGMVIQSTQSFPSATFRAREVVEFAHSDEVSGAIRWNSFCLDVQDGEAKDGANLQIWGCEQGGQHDNRRFIHGTNGTVRWAAHPEFCWEVKDGWRGDGANIYLWHCGADGESPNQQFILPSPGSRGKIRWASEPSKCLDIAGGRKKDGNNVGTWECDDEKENPNQHFEISNGISPEVASAEGGGKIAGAIRWNNFCLDVKDGWVDDGVNIQTWECEEENNNNRFTYGTGTSAIRWTAHPEFCFDVKDGWHGDGANIQLWKCGADGVSPNQLFILPALGMPGRIRWAANQSKCLDVAGGGQKNGTNIETWDCDDAKENPNQMFRLASGIATL